MTRKKPNLRMVYSANPDDAKLVQTFKRNNNAALRAGLWALGGTLVVFAAVLALILFVAVRQ